MKRVSACLRIVTADPEIEFIQAALGRAPSRTRLKGTLKSPGNPASAVFQESLCLFESDLPSSREPHEHLEVLLDLLETRSDPLNRVRDKLIDIDIFCGFRSDSGQGSFEIRADVLERLAKQRVDLILDLYPPVPEADE